MYNATKRRIDQKIETAPTGTKELLHKLADDTLNNVKLLAADNEEFALEVLEVLFTEWCIDEMINEDFENGAIKKGMD